MFNVGGSELLIILLVALVFLGPTRLPDVARQVGQTISSLRSMASGFQAEMQAAAQPDALKPQIPVTQTHADQARVDQAAAEQPPVVNQIAQANAVLATDPDEIADQARKVSADFSNSGTADSTGADSGVSAGGPTDLASDEEE